MGLALESRVWLWYGFGKGMGITKTVLGRVGEAPCLFCCSDSSAAECDNK